ncbi:MAG TPA: anti-sigma factor antagonist [Bacteroidetes bacterium]|nr:STAS domain-containing protein [Ignavibacteria bacterium]HCA43524.1 anti-sigma factor antagonist [Bacteroidota bacterium]HCN38668.1 anti-sigma factor antagonist [Bacteroidota bacterium]
MEEFNIDIKNNNDITILYLDGFLDAHTSGELEKSFEKLIEEKKYKIVVNFDKLSYISSAGLGVFMAYIETMRNNNGDVKLSNMSDKIYNIFDMLGFPILFEIYKEEQTALEKFNQ